MRRGTNEFNAVTFCNGIQQVKELGYREVPHRAQTNQGNSVPNVHAKAVALPYPQNA